MSSGNLASSPGRRVYDASGPARHAQAASIGLHASLGFRHVGTLQSVGLKFGRWLDTVLMQRALGGDA